MRDQRRPMPLAYFLTFTCYGTWLHGRAPGSVDRDHNQYGEPLLPVDSHWEARTGQKLWETPFELDAPRRKVVLATLLEVSRHRGWQVLAIHVRTNHVQTRESG